jgi:UDP-N-acetylmuramyl pentapeptide phosphotransferase/UDP-N-acetylglucosamine-1-phosphate transferase
LAGRLGQQHPERTPFYGGALVIAAVLAATLVTEWHATPSALRIAVYLLGAAVAAVGVLMTFRDLP